MREFDATDPKSLYDGSQTPIGVVAADEIFVVETLDCFGGRFVDDADYTPANLRWVDANLNPLTGPIGVEGATPGDVLAVSIHAVEVTTEARFVRSRYQARSPQDWWYEEYGVVSRPVRDGAVWVNDRLPVPVMPVVGCIGTAPEREVQASPKQGTFGGNMDCNLIGSGATIDLPVRVDGGKLYFGDVKAAMGDGELVNAAEVGSRITASVTVSPQPPEMVWPRVRTAAHWATVVSDISLAQASRVAFRELAEWVAAMSWASREEVVRVLGLAAHVGTCQVSNPLHTAHCRVPMSVLEPLLT